MAASAYPRMYFTGHFYWNPSTYNNDDYQSKDYPNPLVPYDAAHATPTFKTFLAKQHPPVSKANFRHWSKQLYTLAPGQQLAPPEWNYFGGNQCGFVTDDMPKLEQPEIFTKPSGTKVRGWTDTEGTYSDVGDDWLGLDLQFNAATHLGPFRTEAKLIDTDPTSPFTSQIFADNFMLGTPDVGFSAPVSQRMHSRWLYFKRNLNTDHGLMIAGIASATFQTGLRYDDITWNGGSKLQDQLRSAARQAEGVILQFAAYDTMYFNGEKFFGKLGDNQFPGMVKMQQLYQTYFEELEAYKKGKSEVPPQPPCNRAYSRVTGWIGVWDKDEFVTVPGGRLLLPDVLPKQQSGLPTPKPVTPAQAASVPPTVPPSFPVPLGPATVEAVGDPSNDTLERITVNLISTIPEWDSSGVRAEFGRVNLAMMNKDGKPTKLVTVADTRDGAAYKDLYDTYGGLVDIAAQDFAHDVSLSEFNGNPLVLTVDSYPEKGGVQNDVVALTENPLNAQANVRGQYVDEPGDEAGPTVHFRIDVQAFGKKPSELIGLVVAQYSAGFQLLGDNKLVDVFYRTPSGDDLPIDDTTVVDASSGSVTIGLRGVAPGMPILVFFPVANEYIDTTKLSPSCPIKLAKELELPGGPPGIYYAAVRVLPFHNKDADAFAHWLAGQPAKDVDDVNHRVFSEVYETFHLMYPVMDFIGTPQKFQEWRGRILQVTDPKNFDKAGYMPPTRSLSAGQRRILEMYDRYLDGVNAPDSALRRRRPAGPPPRG